MRQTGGTEKQRGGLYRTYWETFGFPFQAGESITRLGCLKKRACVEGIIADMKYQVMWSDRPDS